MPHFYFHLHNGDGWLRDLEGRDIADLEAVDEAARGEARALAAADIADGKTVLLDNFISVDDEAGAEVARVIYSQVVSFG
jgi:hypothetical protein